MLRSQTAIAVAAAASATVADAAVNCCWSKWGDASTCGNYPSSGKGGLCSTEWTKSCSGPGDCPTTPVPPPTPPPTPAPPTPAPGPPTPAPPTPAPLPPGDLLADLA